MKKTYLYNLYHSNLSPKNLRRMKIKRGKMKMKVTYSVGLFWVILIMGCSSAPRITMMDVSTPVSEQSRILLTGSIITLVSIDGELDFTSSSYVDDGFVYFPSGRHTIVVNAERSYVDYSDYNSRTNTQTVVTLSGNYLNFTLDFLPQRTYTFIFETIDGNHFLVLRDVADAIDNINRKAIWLDGMEILSISEQNQRSSYESVKTWESPKIAMNAPKSGRITNWDWPVIGPLINPFVGLGLHVGYSNIERYADSAVGVMNFGDFDISGQFVVQGGIGLHWKNFGISIVPELGGGFGSFYIAQYHYALMADVYFNKFNAGFGFGTFQGAHDGWEDIVNIPTPFLRGTLTYNFNDRLDALEIGGYFDYFYENNSLGFGLLINTKWFPIIIRQSLN